MDRYDQHLHSRHSFDCRATPADNVLRAIEQGLSGLTFTEHFDTHPDDWPSCVYDERAYAATIDDLRRRFGTKLFVGKGIEVCYQPDRMGFILDHLNRHRFDVVILSVHYFDGKPVHRCASWAGIDAETGMRRYLESVRDAVRCCAGLHKKGGRVFDILGHLDLAKRYTLRFFDHVPVPANPSLIDDILRACLEADIVPEINTSSLRQGLEETMPGAETLRRYAQLGGSAISLGSDAHRAEDIGAGFDLAVSQALSAGLKHLAVFKERARSFESLE